MAHDNISYAKRKIFSNKYNITKIFGITIFLLISILISLIVIDAIEIKYTDSYLSKNKFNNNGYTLGDSSSIKNLIKETKGLLKSDVIKSKYPKIEISESNKQPIMDIELIDHTEFCTINCYSILNVNINKKTKLLDKIETKIEGSSIYTNNIKIDIYILKNISYITQIPKYIEICNNFSFFKTTSSSNNILTNNKDFYNITNCYTIASNEKENKIEWKEEFVIYDNEKLEPGNYVVKIMGKKNNFYDVIDWVPTILNEKIEALAWWNITKVYGNGTLGDVYFSTTTKTYGNMINTIDYNVIGDTLYLMTDRIYNLNSLYLGAGTTLSTSNTSGSVIYILSKINMTILGTINLASKLNPGQFYTSFSYLGDSFTTPTVGDGGNSMSGAAQGYGFGGGGQGGGGTVGSCAYPSSGSGGQGNYPFGPTGTTTSATSSGAGCVVTNGNTGFKSGGASGISVAYDIGYGCTITATGGAGGAGYGANGAAGTASGSHGGSYSCTSGSAGSGGAGSGGSAGISGLNLVLRSSNLTLIGGTNSIILSGTNGQAGGNGGLSYWWSWGGSGCYSCGGFGGGGGGGGSSGSFIAYYKYLTNLSDMSSLIVQTAGTGGNAAANGGCYSGSFTCPSTYMSQAGSVGSVGTITLYREGFVETNLIKPSNGSVILITPAILFNVTIIPYNVTLINATIYIWNTTTTYTNTTIILGTSPLTLNWILNSSVITNGEYKWGVETCYTDGSISFCSQTNNNSFSASSYTILSQIYNSSTYETSLESLKINLSSDIFLQSAYIIGYLIYDGVSYLSTKSVNGNVITFSNNIDINTVSQITNKSFYWSISTSDFVANTPLTNQTINPIYFTRCNSTNNITYINFTYKDEMEYFYINASVPLSNFNYWLGSGTVAKTYFFSNSTETPYTDFCFSPKDKTLNTNWIYQATSLGYITRTFNSIINYSLTNVSTGILYYLIKSIDSDSVTIQVVDLTSANAIQGARVIITRDIQGTQTTIADGYTDAAGSMAVFLSSVVSYTITVSKSGCGVNTQTITPAAGSYTMNLNCAGNTTKFVSFIDGVTYQRGPNTGVSIPGNTNFNYYVSSLIYPIVSVRFELRDNVGTGALLAFNQTDVSAGYSWCNTTSCLLTINYYTASGDNVKGRYYINLGNQTNYTYVLLERDAYWRYIMINANNSQQAWKRTALHFNDFMYVWTGGAQTNCLVYKTAADCTSVSVCKWLNRTEWDPKVENNFTKNVEFCMLKDDVNKLEFSRVLMIFFCLVILLFIMGRGINYEMTNPGSFVLFMAILIVILSIAGMFTFAGLTPWEWFNQYIYAYICVTFALGYNLSIIRRYSA